MNTFLKNIKGDKVIWVIVLILCIFSILAVYSSISTLAYKYKGGNTGFYFFKHFFLLGFGLLLLYLTHLLNHNFFIRISKILIIVTVPLLALTLISGTNLNDANRWLTVPVINISFQTSDLAKLTLIIFLAGRISKKKEEIKNFKEGLLPLIVPIGLVCGLILQANFSTAALLAFTSMILLFMGGAKVQHLLSLAGIALAGFMILISIAMVYPKLLPRFGTWKNRVENFVDAKDNDANYQAEQSKIAIATGGILGKMPGKSVQRNFLPHPYSDFIYAVIIEEYGLFGGILMVMLYLILLYRGVNIAIKCERLSSSLIVIGLTFSLVFQALINMAVAVNLFPVTGQPLPLVSMGGTSLWFTSIALGIILSISRTVTDEPEESGKSAGSVKGGDYATI